MRKTTITPNRSTTYTLSWLAKAASALLFVSLFLVSCEEDINTVGFKPDRNRFKVRYVEIEIPSSVMLTGPVVTSNRGGDGRTPRLLAGSYTHPQFGKFNAETHIQFRPSNPNGILPSDAALESLVLNLTFDYYINTASTTITNPTFYVHELTDSLITEGLYYNNSVADYNPSPIGSTTYSIDPVYFNDRIVKNTSTDTTTRTINNLAITLDQTYADRLFQLAKSSTTAALSEDFSSFRKFRRIFKGLVVRSDADDRIVGFNPSYSATGNYRSRLLMYYRFTDTAGVPQRGRVEFSLYDGSISFSTIKADRSNSSLQGMDDVYIPFYPDGDNRFIQAGVPVVTKLDFSKFFSYTDTLKNVLINSAEISIDPVSVSAYPLPASLGLRLLNGKNEYVTGSDTIPTLYRGQIIADSDGYLVLSAISGQNEVVRPLVLSTTDNISTYKQDFTQYFQTLYSVTDKAQRLINYALVPVSPPQGKSVNSLVFDQQKLKLKLYFTTPSTSTKE